METAARQRASLAAVPPGAPPQDTAKTVSDLAGVLGKALRGLGNAGRTDDACKLAASAWSLLRRQHPAEAERLTGLLHYLARLQPPPRQPHQHSPRIDHPKERVMTAEDRQLDVRSEIPARRHELIFETYEALAAGEGFVLVNDHDPKPLYYQFEAEKGGQFSWDYLEEGPQTWRVRIGRTAAAAQGAGEAPGASTA